MTDRETQCRNMGKNYTNFDGKCTSCDSRFEIKKNVGGLMFVGESVQHLLMLYEISTD
jgi:hypothetical protein